MAWEIRFTKKAQKALLKVGKPVAQRIIQFLVERAARAPRSVGRIMSGPFGDFGRYRVGKYRILAKIEDEGLIVLVADIGHRKEIYKRH